MVNTTFDNIITPAHQKLVRNLFWHIIHNPEELNEAIKTSSLIKLNNAAPKWRDIAGFFDEEGNYQGDPLQEITITLDERAFNETKVPGLDHLSDKEVFLVHFAKMHIGHKLSSLFLNTEKEKESAHFFSQVTSSLENKLFSLVVEDLKVNKDQNFLPRVTETVSDEAITIAFESIDFSKTEAAALSAADNSKNAGVSTRNKDNEVYVAADELEELIGRLTTLLKLGKDAFKEEKEAISEIKSNIEKLSYDAINPLLFYPRIKEIVESTLSKATNIPGSQDTARYQLTSLRNLITSLNYSIKELNERENPPVKEQVAPSSPEPRILNVKPKRRKSKKRKALKIAAIVIALGLTAIVATAIIGGAIVATGGTAIPAIATGLPVLGFLGEMSVVGASFSFAAMAAVAAEATFLAMASLTVIAKKAVSGIMNFVKEHLGKGHEPRSNALQEQSIEVKEESPQKGTNTSQLNQMLKPPVVAPQPSDENRLSISSSGGADPNLPGDASQLPESSVQPGVYSPVISKEFTNLLLKTITSSQQTGQQSDGDENPNLSASNQPGQGLASPTSPRLGSSK